MFNSIGFPVFFRTQRAASREAPAGEEQEIDDDELQRRVLEETLKEVAATHEEEVECCVICLDEISDPCELVPCKHTNFDFGCAKDWFAIDASCPLCKRKVTGLLRGRKDDENRPRTAVSGFGWWWSSLPPARPYVEVQQPPPRYPVARRSVFRTPEQIAADERRVQDRRREARLREERREEQVRQEQLRRLQRREEERLEEERREADRRREERRQERLEAERRREARRPQWGPPQTTTDYSGADVAIRRQIYRNMQFSMHVGSNRVSQYQELTPQMFMEDEHLVSRARMFIRRELQVFYFLATDDFRPEYTLDGGNPNEAPDSAAASITAQPGTGSPAMRRRANNAEFLLEYIVAILKSVDMVGSMGAARDMLSDFLGPEHSRLFLHELRSWLRSPFNRLEHWDMAVQYPPTLASLREAEERRQRQQQERDREEAARRRQEIEQLPPQLPPPQEQQQQQQQQQQSNQQPQQQPGPSRPKGDYYRPDGSNIERWLNGARHTVRHEPYPAPGQRVIAEPRYGPERHPSYRRAR